MNEEEQPRREKKISQEEKVAQNLQMTIFGGSDHMTTSGPVGGTPMVSRPGKATIAQYICFSNGIPEPPSASDKMNLFDPTTRPTEAIKMQIIQEL